MKPRTNKIGLRGHIALNLGKLASWASKATGRGSGGMIGGRVALKVDPEIMAKLARNKKVVIVTGTNGKSTTTKMTCAALSTMGKVATNDRGDNMYDGVVTALINGVDAEYAVLEVDEMHVEKVAQQVRPHAFILLNLSRDQLDRVGEITTIEKRIRAGVNTAPQATVIANCDDPMIASAAWDSTKQIWCACSVGWNSDSTISPRTFGAIKREGNHWVGLDETGKETDFSRPEPHWYYDEDLLNATKDGQLLCKVAVNLKLPGLVNRMNAMQALACAYCLGADFYKALRAIENVEQVAGRYSTVDVEGRKTRMLLAKNPAGWAQSIAMVANQPATELQNVIIAVNGLEADGVDLSWLWDVDFERIAQLQAQHKELKVYASGQRASDLSVRLMYAGVEHEKIDDVLEAVKACDKTVVQLMANYTAFRDIKNEFRKHGYKNI